MRWGQTLPFHDVSSSCCADVMEVVQMFEPCAKDLIIVSVAVEILERVQGEYEQGRQDREPLRGKSASERVSESVSVFRGF